MISTFAPASSSLALMVAASSLLTPSLTAFGALSTNAGFRQAEAGDFANGLDDLDLLRACICEIPGSGLLGGRAAAASPAAARRPALRPTPCCLRAGGRGPPVPRQSLSIDSISSATAMIVYLYIGFLSEFCRGCFERETALMLKHGARPRIQEEANQ